MSVTVTICIPTHNRANYIGRALRSITDQSFPKKDYEIIVIDDGSRDKTSLVLKGFANDIFLIKNKKKLGLSRSLNKAIMNAKGKYFLRLDSDDYVNKDFIKILHMFIEQNKDFDAAMCDYYIVDDNEKILKRVNCNEKPIACGVIFKIEDLKKVGKYSENIKINEDKDLIKKLKKKNFKILRVPLPLYRYRKHNNNMTRNKSDVF
jgi:glycosyltransferase involved in cell wall biosynthesis